MATIPPPSPLTCEILHTFDSTCMSIDLRHRSRRFSPSWPPSSLLLLDRLLLNLLNKSIQCGDIAMIDDGLIFHVIGA